MKLQIFLSSVVFAILLLLHLGGCGDGEDAASIDAESPRAATRPAAAVERDLPRVVFLGDSLTAGYGLEKSQAFPALLSDQLADAGLPVEVVNAGVSGDTTAGGLSRLDWILRQEPDVLVVGLGGNDGLRGTAVSASEQNLRDIVTRARDADTDVLLLGMLIPPNYGVEYTSAFRDLYPRVAEELDVPLVPFLLEGVGGDPTLNQGDGIHPTSEGHRILAENVLPFLQPLLERRAETAVPAAE